MRSVLFTVIWVVSFSLSSLYVCPAIPFWPKELLLKDQLLSLWGSLCRLFVVFPLLLLIFVLCVWSLLIWLICVLGCFTLGYSVWDSLCFLDLGDYFLPHFREVFNYYLLKCFLMVFLFVFFRDSYNSNVGAFHIVLEVSEIVLISFNLFFFFPLWFIYFYHSIFYFTNPIFCLRYSTIFASRVFLISFIALFIIYWLFFNFF